MTVLSTCAVSAQALKRQGGRSERGWPWLGVPTERGWGRGLGGEAEVEGQRTRGRDRAPRARAKESRSRESRSKAKKLRSRRTRLAGPWIWLRTDRWRRRVAARARARTSDLAVEPRAVRVTRGTQDFSGHHALNLFRATVLRVHDGSNLSNSSQRSVSRVRDTSLQTSSARGPGDGWVQRVRRVGAAGGYQRLVGNHHR